MKSRTRPSSSKNPPNIPIYIDDSESDSFCNCENRGRSLRRSQTKPRLNQIMPDMPRFPVHSNSTAMLYSKFIVKGLKNDKIHLVRNALKKKQEITEAETHNPNQAHSRLFSKPTEHHDLIRDEKDAYINDLSDSAVTGFQPNNFLRASSAKVFHRGYDAQPEEVKQLSKQMTEVNLLRPKNSQRRPKTAKQTPQMSSQPTLNSAQRNRPSTANKNRAQEEKKLHVNNFMESNELIRSKLALDRPIKVEDDKMFKKGVNHIQNNKRQVSSYSRKSSSIYLTNAHAIESITRRLQPQTSKINEIIQHREQQAISSMKIDKSDRYEEQPLSQPQPQAIFTKIDRERVEDQVHSIEDYLKQAMPAKFQRAREQIRKETRAAGQAFDDYGELLSKNLDNQSIWDSDQIQESAALSCFKDYISHCDVIQYNIRSQLKKPQKERPNNNVLDVWQCQQLFELNTKRNSIQCTSEQKRSALQKMRTLTKKLKYFYHQQQSDNQKFFALPFQIEVMAEGHLVIPAHSKVQFMFVILNGSVVSQVIEEDINQDGIPSSNRPQIVQVSLFDGEVFGVPRRPSETVVKNSFTTLEQTILMKVPYLEFTKCFIESSEFEEKIEVLKLALASQLQNRLLRIDDLEMISLALQKHRFPSKSLIFRQGDIFDKLILIGKGKLQAINEQVLVRQKEQPKDMKERDRNLIRPQTANPKDKQKQTKSTINQLFANLRRRNLINYEVLKETINQIFYYYTREQNQFVKGDILNWEPFHEIYGSSDKSASEELNSIMSFARGLMLTPKTFSLLTVSDDTQIYTLSRSSFDHLPMEIKKVLLAKAGKRTQQFPQKVSTEKQIREWDDYKRKLCEQIRSEKKLRKV